MSSIGFTGTELLKNIKKRTYTSKAELVRECGYQEVDYYGVEKINYSKFYDEFLKAFGVSIKKKYSSDTSYPLLAESGKHSRLVICILGSY